MAAHGADVLPAIRELLDRAAIQYREVQHGPVRTSEEAAQARNEPLEIGGKALLIKLGGDLRLCVLPAHLRLDSAALKAHFGVRKTRFATPEELLEHTGLVPGSVPPFGEPILPFPLCIDERIASGERIAFNAGSLSDSIVLSTADYLAVARPEDVLRLAREADS